MDFALTGDQEMLKALVERFVSERYASSAVASHRSDERGYSDGNWILLAEIGLLALPFAAAYGGLDGGDGDIITAMEALGRGLVCEPVLNEIFVAAMLLQAAGTELLQRRWIPRIIAGEAHLALAHAEHAMRFDLARCETRYAHGVLSGHKTGVPGTADAFIVTAWHEQRLGLFLVEAGAAGVSRRDYRVVDGSVASEVRFDGVAADPLPGGLAELEGVVDTARMAACGEMLGLMELLLETTLEYVRQRRQFGVAIGSFQAIQHRLADVYTSLELSRSQLCRCVTALGERSSAIAAAKSYISTSAIRLGEECIQLHGGMGVSDELLIGHAHKRLLVLASFFGDADYELTRYNRKLREGLAVHEAWPAGSRTPVEAATSPLATAVGAMA